MEFVIFDVLSLHIITSSVQVSSSSFFYCTSNSYAI